MLDSKPDIGETHGNDTAKEEPAQGYGGSGELVNRVYTRPISYCLYFSKNLVPLLTTITSTSVLTAQRAKGVNYYEIATIRDMFANAADEGLIVDDHLDSPWVRRFSTIRSIHASESTHIKAIG